MIKLITTTHEDYMIEKTIKSSINKNNANLNIESNKGQIWQGFGGCFNELGWKALAHVTDEKRNEIMKDLFEKNNEMQFTYCRTPVGANDYSESWYSLNETENDFEMKEFSIERDKKLLIPYIKEAQKYCGEMALFASPWSPPSWMKFPKAYNYGTLIWEEKYLKAYALYLAKYIEAYEKENIKINLLYVQNEPFVDQKFPSSVWRGKEMTEFIRDYMGPLFSDKNLKTGIGFGTLNGPPGISRNYATPYNNYCGYLFRDAEAMKYVKAVGFQWDGKEVVQRTNKANPDMTLIQTENECGDGENTWQYAHYVFDLIYHYITNNVSAYAYWNMILEPKGMSTWGWKQNSLITIDKEGTVTYNPEYYVMKHFAKYIRPGYRRVELSGLWSDNSVAFEGEGKLVIVVQNPFDRAEEMNFTFRGKDYSVNLAPESFNTIVI